MQDRRIVTTRRIFLCPRLLDPILKAFFMGSLDLIKWKDAESAALILRVSVGANFLPDFFLPMRIVASFCRSSI